MGGTISDSILLAEFCGWGLRVTKSFTLLSVSKPFPESSSSPPGLIETPVENAFAFLSAEVVLLMDDAGPAPSKQFDAGPIPTSSITPAGQEPERADDELTNAI